ncbi:MAG: hypothetical protein RJB13_214 [Pseudomonadota bacterium]
MAHELKIKRRTWAENIEEFDISFANYQPSTAINNKPLRFKYTCTLLNFADTRKSEFWIAVDPQNGEALARLGADVNGINGSLGFMEFSQTSQGEYAASTLITEALDWLKSHGVLTVYGPMDFNSWFNYRFKLQNSDEGLSVNHPWEPGASEPYEQLFRSLGFTDSVKYSSYFFTLSDNSQWMEHITQLSVDYERAIGAGFKIRDISPHHTSEQDIRSIFEISNAAFAGQPMFEQIPFALFSAITLPALTQYNSAPSKICFDSHNRPIGFMFAFLLDDLIVYKSIAVLPEFQAMGIGNAMTLELCRFGMKHNITKCVGALIRSGNKSEMFGKSFEKTAKSSGKNDYILLSRSIR